MSSLWSEPLLTAPPLVFLLELVSSTTSYYFPTYAPVEWADVYSVLVAISLSLYYYLQSLQTVRQTVLLVCVWIWGMRLGIFLSGRIKAGFRDSRLDAFRGSLKGAVKWCLAQTLWISVTLMPVWVGMGSGNVAGIDGRDIVGVGLFVVGILVEGVADEQKRVFMKKNGELKEEERKKYCDVGLFRYARFVNYFGEWLAWTGLCVLVWEWKWRCFGLPICSYFVRMIFYRLSIPIAVQRVEKRCSKEEFEQWQKISLFVPWPRQS